MKLYQSKKIQDLFETLIFFNLEKLSQNRFATLSNEYTVRVFQLPQVFVVRSYTFNQYVYGLCYDQETKNLLVGDGLGFINVLDFQFNLISKYSIHSDLITHIRFDQKQPDLVISSSIDATIKISKKYTNIVVKIFQFVIPVFNFCVFQTKIYVPFSTLNTKVISQYHDNEVSNVSELENHLKQIHVHTDIMNKNLLFGVQGNLRRIINLTEESSKQIECQKLISFNDKLIAFSSNKILLLNSNLEIQGENQSPIKFTETYFNCLKVGDYVAIASDSGNMIILIKQQ